ncbi:MAG: gamma-glutamyl-gamma-aminobutyrate hydrolase family protein [Solirubrobacterales bacterium]
MRVLAIVHQAEVGPGVFAEVIRAGGDRLDEWVLPERPEPPADPLGYDAVLTLGGAMHADQEERHRWLAEELALLRELLEWEVPLLGLCLGGQLLAAAAGATPRRAARPEIGWHQVELTAEGREDPLLGPLAPGFEAFQWHSYEFPLPPGAAALARSEVSLQGCRVGGIAWALQFHPEVSAADALRWIDNYRSDEDAIKIGLDPVALRTETEAKIDAFNQLGRDLCRRWLDVSGERR